ncbi:RICIN domain-containing protein [bacterium]|nr:RICIN domain-containing protein [bacterium]
MRSLIARRYLVAAVIVALTSGAPALAEEAQPDAEGVSAASVSVSSTGLPSENADDVVLQTDEASEAVDNAVSKTQQEEAGLAAPVEDADASDIALDTNAPAAGSDSKAVETGPDATAPVTEGMPVVDELAASEPAFGVSAADAVALVADSATSEAAALAPAPNDTAVQSEPSAVSDLAAPRSTASDEPAAPADQPAADSESVSAIEQETVAVIHLAADPDKVIDIEGGSTASGAYAQVYQQNWTPAQRYRITPEKDSKYSVITNVESGKVLDVQGGVATTGTRVWQYDYNGTDAQRWLVERGTDGLYTFYSALRAADGLRLALSAFGAENGDRLQVSAVDGDLGEATARWALTETRSIADGTYTLNTAVDTTKALDVAGAGIDSGVNVQVYDDNGTNAQRFNVAYDDRTGFYSLTNVGTGLTLDVNGASQEAGANVQLWSPNDSRAQKWTILGNDDGSYTLVSAASGMALDVEGAVATDGRNVWQYGQNGTAAQRWFAHATTALADGTYELLAAARHDVALDVYAPTLVDLEEQHANAQVFRANGGDNQLFQIVAAGDTGAYTIRNVASGKYLSVHAGEAASGDNVDFEAGRGMDALQLWYPETIRGGLTFRSAAGDVRLDVFGAVLENESNVQVWTPNRSDAQRFVLRAHAYGGDTLGVTDLGATVSVGSVDPVAVNLASTTRDGMAYLFLPSNADLASVSLSGFTQAGTATVLFSPSADGVYRDARTSVLDLTTGGYARDETGAYAVFLKDPDTGVITQARIVKSSSLGAMFLSSADPVSEGRAYVEASEDHSAKAKGSMVYVDARGRTVYDGKLTQIKGRGNSTWKLDKRPYQIKLDKKTSLVSGEKSDKAKTWVLLANMMDPTLLRNYVGYGVARAIGLDDTPECELIDLWYDGDYRGSYLLSEKVEVNKGRVDISDLEDENASADDRDIEDHATAHATNAYGQDYRYVRGIVSPADMTGGYLMELDNGYYTGERSWFETDAGYFTLKSPENASREEVAYISELMQRAIVTAIDPNGDASQYFDLVSMAKTFLVQCLAKNADYAVYSSTYFYKDAGVDSPIKSGPIWDLDQGFGGHSGFFEEARTPQNFGSEQHAFFFYNNQFRQTVRDVYGDFHNAVESLMGGLVESTPPTLTSDFERLHASEAMNEMVWDYDGVQVYNNATQWTENFVANASALKDWIAQRLAWMDGTFTSSEW